MVFSSVIFLFFFLPVVLLLHLLLPPRFRNLFLLFASVLFYAWGEVRFLWVMFASCSLDFVAGQLIEREFRRLSADGEARRVCRRTPVQRMALIGSIVGNLSLLAFFKYSHFVVDNVNDLAHALGLSAYAVHFTLQFALPLGISFYTFQSLSYSIDVYRGTIPATRKLADFFCFVTLFPQLIAGPIVRYTDVAQALAYRVLSREAFASGIRLFIIGLGKKVLIANTLAESVDRIFAIPAAQLPTPVAWVGAVFFSLQLLFDFGGYSDMAVGMGRMLGFQFPGNFNYPFISRTVAEFWQRWHITLSSWLRDYLFTPLGGYRVGRRRAYVNVLFVFLICGLWHGASWNFILFGAIPGVLIVFERMVHSSRRAFFTGWTGCVFYIIPIILCCMVIFRSETLSDAGAYFKAMLGLHADPGPAYNLGLFINGEVLVMLAAALLGSVPFAPWLIAKCGLPADGGSNVPVALVPGRAVVAEAVRIVFLAGVLLLCAMKLAAGTYNPFIYFRF